MFGDDHIEGGPGDDRIFTGSGSSSSGPAQLDVAFGAGIDLLVGAAGSQELFGGPDDDILRGVLR